MLADPEDVEADLVGKLDLLHQVAQALARADRLPRAGVRRQLGKGVDPDLHVLPFEDDEAPRRSRASAEHGSGAVPFIT